MPRSVALADDKKLKPRIGEGRTVTFCSVVFPLSTDVLDPLFWQFKPVHFGDHTCIAMRRVLDPVGHRATRLAVRANFDFVNIAAQTQPRSVFEKEFRDIWAKITHPTVDFRCINRDAVI